jgi:hypothetical protein
MNPMLRGMMQGVGGVANELLDTSIDMETSSAAKLKADKAIGKLDLTTSDGLARAAELYGTLGMSAQQAAMASASVARAKEERIFRQTQAATESLAVRAEKAGMPDMAKTLRTGGADVKDAAKAIREKEREDALIKGGRSMRIALLKQARLEPSQVEGWDTMPVDQFTDLIDGNKAALEAYVDASGNLAMYPTNEFGKIRKDGEWQEASELGVKPAPKVQKMINIGDTFAAQVTKDAATGFGELREEGRMAVRNLENNARSQRLLDAGINAGPLANIRTFSGKLAELWGASNDIVHDAARAETYVAERAEMVGQRIKLFGSGTGLSDKDREYAEKMAAGLITMSPQAMNRILAAERRINERILNLYGEAYNKVKQHKSVDATALELLKLPEVDYSFDEESQFTGEKQFSPAAEGYFGQ